MLQIQYFSSLPAPEAAQFSLPPFFPAPPRRRLRLYLVSSPHDTQHEVDRLHLLHYAERFEWSRAVPVAENGVIIRPDPGDVLRYIQRDRRSE
ncbi:MAG: hypothetical protein Fur0046_40490 [Cyanobacteria bacterium J069]